MNTIRFDLAYYLACRYLLLNEQQFYFSLKLGRDDALRKSSGKLFQALIDNNIIIIYRDFLPPPRRGGNVKSDNTHTHNRQDTPLSPYT